MCPAMMRPTRLASLRGYATRLRSASANTAEEARVIGGTVVLVGIVMLVVLLIMSLRGQLGPEKAETVEIVGLYWHFVDIVWILIFAVVYLIP